MNSSLRRELKDENVIPNLWISNRDNEHSIVLICRCSE